MTLGLVPAITLALVAFGAALAHGAEVSGKSKGNPYISGGIGLSSREALRAREGDYNLMVILSLRDGHYLGGARLTVRDKRGKTALKIDAQGPWIFAKLPPGTYSVSAKVGHTARNGRVLIGKKGLKRIHLIWDREPV